MSQTYCTQCGSPLPETSNFCPACGAPRATAPANPTPDAGQAAVLPSSGESRHLPGVKARRTPWLAGGLLGLLVVAGIVLYFVAFRDDPRSAIPDGCVVGQPCESAEVAGASAAGGAVAGAATESNIPFPEVVRISVADAKARADAGGVTFIDVRDSEYYAQAHIPGSLSIPLTEIETSGAQLPTGADIILYCT